ncbi:glycosyltransferase family 9 protein [Mucilaginibacter achroorhodeus]|uniref:Glycosyltransferase family 9 protein n=1 Tax=Mucilaginibacter achroorhodeus TaxID=2599294 RepID=A0A563TX88_9SPHI|nr:glycosyltransferase family 9 protein [Mucilaginibacter achroorhodeus]TWR23926.1 glycosyltransferase family 9 protein [Mucilaginibacter achroorhodeus]
MHIQNRNLFRLTRFVLLKLPKLFAFFARFRKPATRLLIIKTDAIGDYILFRNFIELTAKSEKYKGYKIDLIGNQLWHGVTATWDAPFLYQTYFVKPNSFYEAPLKTLRFGWRLFLNNYDTVLQPTYTRTFITDGFAALTAAREIVGYISDNEGIVPRYKSKTDRFYTTKMVLPTGVYFEFHRNKFFFDTVLGQPLNVKQPYIDIQAVAKKGIAILPGAGEYRRGWERQKFLQLIERLIAVADEPIYLIGGPGEKDNGDYLHANLPAGSVVNLINTTTLPQLIESIAACRLLISNETGATHIAVATKTPSVCILGGGHFERFAPYPQDVHPAPACVFEKMPCYYCNWDCIYKPQKPDNYPCIAAIEVEKVWQAVKPFLAL